MSSADRPTPSLASSWFLAPACALALAIHTAGQAGTVGSWQKISATAGGFGGDLDVQDLFGIAAAPLGDLDGDGVADLAVGAWLDDDGAFNQGAVWILFLDTDGTVKAEQKISATAGGFGGDLDTGNNFGGSISSLGDLDGDGVVDLAVGAPAIAPVGDGAVWILFLNADGTVESEQEIGDAAGGFGGVLDTGDSFGSSVASVGDLDGDGIADLAVGASGDDDGDVNQGALWILFLNADGTVKAEQKISATAGGFGGNLDANDRFGGSGAGLGDLDGDGVADLVAGAPGDDDAAGFAFERGAVWVLFLDPDGTVKAHQKISDTAGGFGGDLDNEDFFGISVGTLGDLDGDGVSDLAVGATLDDDGINGNGAVWILFLHSDGTVKAHQKISTTEGGLDADLGSEVHFGTSVACPGDLDGDGIVELAVGAGTDDDGGVHHNDNLGAVWILFLRGPQSCLELDFETEDDLVTPLVNGQHIDVEFGSVATLTSSGPNAGLAIFDSTVGGPNDPGQDPDLLVGTGHVLVLQTENLPPDANDVFPRPNDDEDGGTIAFEFAVPFELQSLRLVDCDAGDGASEVVLQDSGGRRRTYTVPANWTGDLVRKEPGHRVLDLTTLAPQAGFGSVATAVEDPGFHPLAVVRMDVHLAGSGALDDLALCSSSLPRAAVTVRNGSGENRARLVSEGRPALGETWTASLECAGSGARAAVLDVRSLAAAGLFTPFGEVLVQGALLHRAHALPSFSRASFAWDVPHDLALLGLEVHVQGLCWSAAAGGPKLVLLRGTLSNALDLVLGL